MRLFVYGTLLDPDLRTEVVGRAVEGAPAVLRGWRRHAARGRSYPMILPAADAAVSGLVLDLDPAAAARIHGYEGGEYVRRAVTAERLADGRPVSCFVYAVRPGRLVAAGAWDFAAWQAARSPAHIVASSPPST